MPILEVLLAACEAYDLPAIREVLRALPLDYEPFEDETTDRLWNEVRSPSSVSEHQAPLAAKLQ
jgi:hypothetical protein